MFSRHLDLPRGPEREVVRERDRSYELDGRECDALATVAAFRVVQVSDVRELFGHEHSERSPRELTHDVQVYRACRDVEAQIRDQGGRIRRVVLDYELKREYQQFLQARNRGRADSTGRPDRTPEEVAAWAKDHDLPYQDGRVRFPDARVEFEDRDRLEQHRDIEVLTPHYRGAHAAAVAGSGFQRYGSGPSMQTNGRRGGRGFDPRAAEDMLG